MVVISHFKLYPPLFPLKWFICIPNISDVWGNVVFETLHGFYRTAIIYKGTISLTRIVSGHKETFYHFKKKGIDYVAKSKRGPYYRLARRMTIDYKY